MRRLYLFPLLAAVLLTGCKQPAKDRVVGAVDERGYAEAALLLDGREHEHFGLGARDGAATPVADVLADPALYDGREMRISGVIAAVCKQAGCWARVRAGERELFVKMKDHAFLLPLDCEGRAAVLEGLLSIEETSVEELQHYAQDAGQSEAEIAAIVAPKREVVLIASGVALAK